MNIGIKSESNLVYYSHGSFVLKGVTDDRRPQLAELKSQAGGVVALVTRLVGHGAIIIESVG